MGIAKEQIMLLKQNQDLAKAVFSQHAIQMHAPSSLGF
jgi:hypothetical protein